MPDFPQELVVWKYGAEWFPLRAGKTWIRCPDWNIELQILQLPEDQKNRGYRGFEYHFREFVTALLGNPNGVFGFQWNPNAERILKAIIGHKFLAIMGCASSGKSKSLAGIALCFWLLDPFKTKVLVTSTTVKTAKGKIWGDIQEAWQAAMIEARDSTGGAITLPGTFLGSTQQIRYEYGGVKSDKAGIELIPTDANKQKEASEKMQGYKRGNVILLGDEWDTLPPMLLKTARSNLFANPSFRLWGAFNPTGRFTNGGQFAKPSAGWDSIDEDSMEWATERGWCIRFDGLKSPNVLAGKIIFTGLYSLPTLREHERDLGRDSPAFWAMCRGWFPPTGETNSIYSDAELIQHKANLTVELSDGGWELRPEMVAGLDPAWTHDGDRAVLTIAKCGTAQFKLPNGQRESRKVYEKLRTIVLDNEITDKKTDKTEQIIVLVKKYLAQYGVPVENLAVDVTGAAPFVSLLVRDIGSGFIRVMFSGAASDMPISRTDRRKACDVYADLMTEIWCIGKPLVRGGQIKGLDDDVMDEMCARTFREGNGKGVKTQVLPKSKMKKLGHRSPDRSDSNFLGIHAARVRCGLSDRERPKLKAPDQSKDYGFFTGVYQQIGITKSPKRANFDPTEQYFVAGGWDNENL